ncbi:MAG: hypothetical protein MUO87_00050, partial [Thermoplasmata archaeon]|nr:hypothetical protein [Thermoplasmata archaeon]
SVNLTDETLGSLSVACWAFDATGNGYVGGSDYLQVFTYGGATGFSSATTYTLVLMYEPTGGMIGNGLTFTG